MPYKAPKKLERREALLGTSEKVQAAYKKAFSTGVRRFFRLSYKGYSQFFKQISNSDPSDWLLNHKEVGQTFEEFSRRIASNDVFSHSDSPVSCKERTISILPIGEFSSIGATTKSSKNVLISWLESYCAAFYSTAQVTILKAVSLEKVACEYRVNEFTGRYQLNASDILSYLRQRKTKNQDCLIAVTMVDLYPKPSWNFVFGLASTNKDDVGGVGVFSFCRYADNFYETWSLSEDKVKIKPDGSLDYSVFASPATTDAAEIDGTQLLRACKVMTHEVCHMFGLKHCIWMQCLMNGSNHLEESDRRPLHLCPVCLRKLQSVLKFNVLERYNTLYEWTFGSFMKSQSSAKFKGSKHYSKGSQSDAESSHSCSSSASSNGSRRKSSSHTRLSPSNKSKNHMQSRKGVKDFRTGHVKTETPAPLIKFRSFREWLLDAIEFISTDGKPGVFSSYSSQLRSLYR